MNLTPAVVAGWIAHRATNRDFRPLGDVFLEILTAELRSNASRHVSDEEIAEIVERDLPAVGRALAEVRELDIAEGITPRFEVDFADPQQFLRCRDTPESELLGRLLVMSPGGFERFCSSILAKMHASSVVRGGTNDGGVDFYAIGLSLGIDLGPVPPSAKTVVVGQAKRWKATREVAETDLRMFVGGALAQADSLRLQHPDRFGLFTPVSLAFWATCGFTTSARRYARAMGIWYLSGVSLSQLATRLGLNTLDADACELAAKPVFHG